MRDRRQTRVIPAVDPVARVLPERESRDRRQTRGIPAVDPEARVLPERENSYSYCSTYSINGAFHST